MLGNQKSSTSPLETNNKMSQKEQVTDDDLDAILDDVLTDIKTGPPVTSIPVAPKEPQNDTPQDEEELQKELQAGMEELLKSLSMNETQETDEMKEMKGMMEQLMQGLSVNESVNTPSMSSKTAMPSTTSSASSTSSNFQDRINNHLHRMHNTSSQVSSDVNSVLQSDMMDLMMKQMEELLNNSEFEGMLQGMVDQLVTKEILYEPMKDLLQKYQPWYDKHSTTLSIEEQNKCTQQLAIIKEIIQIFDSVPEGQETNQEQNKKIMDLTQQMQELGNPPEEVLKEFAPDMEVGPDGVPKFDLPGMNNKDCKQM